MDHDPVTGQDLPKVPFPSAYVLTAQQEADLCDRAKRRLLELEDESGRMVTENLNWYQAPQDLARARWTFFGRRHLFEMSYYNRVEWRRWLLGGIFAESNFPAPISRQIVRKMTAKANDHFFSTQPFFAVYPINYTQQTLADEVNKYAQFKIDQSKTQHTLELAIENAFIRGESVVKTTYETEESFYQQYANVLVDESGYDILDSAGDFIVSTDLWVDPGQPGAPDPTTGAPGPTEPSGQSVLKRDGQTPLPQNPIYQPKLITRKRVKFRGAKSKVVYWRDILIPLTAQSVQEADSVIHLYDMPAMQLADMYKRKGLLDATAEEDLESVRRAVELLRNISGNSGQPKTAANQARMEIGENLSYVGTQNSEPIVEIAEIYMRYDANGDGIQEEIMLIMDKKNGTPIFYDYLDNVTPDGTRPFDVVRVNPIDGRWFGQGAMEMFESSQEMIDLTVNRINISQSKAGRMDFWQPSNTLEGDSDPNLELNWGGTCTLKPGKTAEETLSVVTLPDVKYEILNSQLEFFMQLCANESGVSTNNDGQSAGLDSQKLATGIRNIEASNAEMSSLYWSHLQPDLESILERNLKLIFANLDQQEVYTFFEGDQLKTGIIESTTIKDLEIDIQLLLTKYRGQQVLQSSQMATNLIVQYYQLNPQLQLVCAQLYRQMLKALCVDDSDSIIVPQPAQPQQPGGQPPQTQGQNPLTGPAVNVTPINAQAPTTPQQTAIKQPQQ